MYISSVVQDTACIIFFYHSDARLLNIYHQSNNQNFPSENLLKAILKTDHFYFF
jgi:hypothetical protein